MLLGKVVSSCTLQESLTPVQCSRVWGGLVPMSQWRSLVVLLGKQAEELVDKDASIKMAGDPTNRAAVISAKVPRL